MLLLVVTLAVYLPAWWGTFVLDDRAHVVDNPIIQSFTPLDKFFTRRGPVYLSLAVNYALDGVNPRGYHALNVVFHLIAGLALYGSLRRILALPRWSEHVRQTGPWLAVAAALLWMIHPLQTQAVTYVIQRAESLAGMFVLLALYALVRFGERRQLIWAMACILSVLLATATKESVMPAFLALLLVDRAVLAGSFGELLKRRWWLYLLLLGVSLMPLAGGIGEFGQVTGVGIEHVVTPRVSAVDHPPLHVQPPMMRLGYYPSAGFSMPHLTWQQYFFTQPTVIVYYLKLTYWPAWLSLEHNWRPMMTPTWGWSLWPLQVALGVLLSLAVGTLWALWRRPWLGAMGAWFFLFLGVSSSFIPINDLAVEHRMYLAQIPVILATVLAGWMLIGMAVRRGALTPRLAMKVTAVLGVACVLALGVRSAVRNLDYRSDITLWAKAGQGQVANSRIHLNLGSAQYTVGRVEEAQENFIQACRLRPGDGKALMNLGSVHFNRRELEQAVLYYRQSLRFAEASPETWLYLSRAKALLKDMPGALAAARKAHSLSPRSIPILVMLGRVQMTMGDHDKAVATFEKAMDIAGRTPAMLANVGMVYINQGDLPQAAAQFEEAVRIDPSFAPGWQQLAQVRYQLGDHGQAEEALRKAIALGPSMDLSRQLAMLLAGSPDPKVRNLDEAWVLVESGLSLTGRRDPAWLEVAGRVAMASGRPEIALQMEEQAYRIAVERGAPPEVLQAGQATIARLQQLVKQKQQAPTPQPQPTPAAVPDGELAPALP